MTQQQVADRLGMARTSIVALEKGERRIQPRELLQLAEILGETVSGILQRGAPAAAFSAQLRGRLPNGLLDASVLAALDRFQELAEDYVRLEGLRKAPLRPRSAPRIDIGDQDPELVAEDTAAGERLRLGLGDAPISDLRTMLESDVGLRIFQLKLPSRIAGLYSFTPELGACVGVNALHDWSRRRLTQAHEYGHFLENRMEAEISEIGRYSRRPVAERFAESFAYAFLMPEPGLRRRLLDFQRQRGGPPTLADALRLASVYGVSAEAMIRRLESLSLIASGTWERLQVDGLRVTEARRLLGLIEPAPDNDLLPSRFVALALEAWGEGQLSEGQLMAILRESRIQVRERMASCRALDAERTGATNLAMPLAVR